jgi:F-type H+-transporting ATPase subunit b
MEIVRTTALITINETLWVQMLLFLVFLLVINRLMLRPIRRGLALRESHCTDLSRQIGELTAELDRLALQAAEEDARHKDLARRRLESRRTKGRKAAEAVLQAALADIKRLTSQNEARLLEATEQARRDLEIQTQVIAAAIVEKMLDRRPVQ